MKICEIIFIKNMVRICSIDSNIGAGKSKIIENIFIKVKDNKKYIFVPEPLDDWKKIILSDGCDFLTSYYDNISSNALSFQMVALFTRREAMNKKIEEAKKIEEEIGEEVIIITERTIMSDFYTFTKMLITQGHINEHGKIAYEMWFNIFSKEIELSKSLYIRISPNLCRDRISIRNRIGEDSISLKYLKDLDKEHENFYENYLITIDCKVISNEFKLDSAEYNSMIGDIIKFFSD